MKKLIAIMIACLFVSVAGAADSTNSPVFQIRLVLDAPSGDSEQMSIISRKEVVNVQKTVLIDESALKSVQATTDKQGYPQIDLTFSGEGRKRFAEVTRQNVGKRLAFIGAGRLYCAPVIKTEISGGKAMIVGFSSQQEAKDLSAKIGEAISKR
jgi:preprotein translocase subunit SecD